MLDDSSLVTVVMMEDHEIDAACMNGFIYCGLGFSVYKGFYRVFYRVLGSGCHIQVAGPMLLLYQV